MKKSLRIIALFTAMLMLVLSFAACSDNSDNSDKAATSSAAKENPDAKEIEASLENFEKALADADFTDVKNYMSPETDAQKSLEISIISKDDKEELEKFGIDSKYIDDALKKIYSKYEINIKKETININGNTATAVVEFKQPVVKGANDGKTSNAEAFEKLIDNYITSNMTKLVPLLTAKGTEKDEAIKTIFHDIMEYIDENVETSETPQTANITLKKSGDQWLISDLDKLAIV